MIYKNKEYSIIIWDWRSTIYNPYTNTLYPEVEEFIKNTQNLSHILVTWSYNSQRRLELIQSFGADKYFKEIVITDKTKKEAFEYIFDKEEYNPENTIIVGDNENDEIRIANEMGVDSANISDFIKLAKI